MENHKLVLPGHLNHYGFLFGGNLLQWVDEYAWIGASLDYPGAKFVTIGMDRVEFRRNIRNGTILKFVIERGRVGSTSVQYGVLVFRGNGDECDNALLFSTNVTFVNVDGDGHKVPLPIFVDRAGE
jgi:acyl-CoA hydrolase